MTIFKSVSLEDIRARGVIRDQDVRALGAALATTFSITAEEADALLRLHASCPIQDPKWSALLVDTISDYIIRQAEPDGYVISENARWLIQRISSFGLVNTSTELMLLVQVLERARWTPPSLVAFCLEQVRAAVETGRGPLRAAMPAAPGTITDADVHLIAQIIRAFGSEVSLPITRTEADSLFAIHRAIRPDDIPETWQKFFVDTVGSGVLAALGHTVVPRGEMSVIPTHGADGPGKSRIGDPDLAMSLPTSRHPGGVTIWATAPLLSPEELAIMRLERQRFEIVTNETIDDPTADWLMQKLGEKQYFDPAETELLLYITREASSVPSAFSAYAARAYMAA
ncbi:MAG: hypothetical protein ACK5JT_19385 [Hyphomicrobiaceae bacterium]